MAKNRVIGNKSVIPWHVPEDLKWFKEFTMNKSIIVGKSTFSTLPNLKNRKVFVITSDIGPEGSLIQNKNGFEGIKVNTCQYAIDNNCILAGGASTYKSFLPFITEFYVTHINGEYKGDTFMPIFEHLFNKQEIIREFGNNHKVVKYSERK